MKKWYSLILLIVLFSCKKKEEDYLISGTVFNPELNQSVSQMQISLWGTTVSNGSIQNQFSQLASVQTASDGSFSFKFKKSVYSALKLVLYRSDYFQQETAINPDNLSPGKEYKMTIQSHALGWIKTTIQNTGTQHDADNVYYKLSLPYTSCTTCCNTSAQNFSGASVNTSWTCNVYGGSKITIQWIYTYNTINQSHFDTLLVPVNDTLAYPIFY